MKKALALAWIVLGVAVVARVGLFVWRLTFGYGDIIHVNIFVLTASLLLGATLVFGRRRRNA